MSLHTYTSIGILTNLPTAASGKQIPNKHY